MDVVPSSILWTEHCVASHYYIVYITEVFSRALRFLRLRENSVFNMLINQRTILEFTRPTVGFLIRAAGAPFQMCQPLYREFGELGLFVM